MKRCAFLDMGKMPFYLGRLLSDLSMSDPFAESSFDDSELDSTSKNNLRILSKLVPQMLISIFFVYRSALTLRL